MTANDLGVWVYAIARADRAAEALGISTATAYRHWAYARAWLQTELLTEK